MVCGADFQQGADWESIMNSENRPDAKPVLDDRQRAVARELQGDIPVVGRPYREVAETIGMTEDEVIAIAADLLDRGIIRKIGAIVRHRQAGYLHNVMVVWAVPDGRIEEIGRRFSAFPEVTHCYERKPLFDGRYSLFTMVHLHSQKDESLLKEMSELSGITDFKVLQSLEEFKKKSMEYF